MKHKLVARYSESLGRKQYVLACGAPLEGQKIASEWRSTKCKECLTHRKRRKRALSQA
jgi:predicted nucleic acid-binding Zn ribbon protein